MTISGSAISELSISEDLASGSSRLTGLLRRRGNPAWTRDAQIGDVGGSLDKRNSETEGEEPYAAMVLRELRNMRGSAFSQKNRSLVDAENVALARCHAAVWFRTPEKMRANATPHRADELLDYWAEVLAVTVSGEDARWQVRERCVAAYPVAAGATEPFLNQALTDLLGEAFVSIDFPSQNLASVEVTQPAGVEWASFLNLVYVQAHGLLDTALSGWADFSFVEV